MWSARVLDPDHPIIELVWSGRVDDDEVQQANEKLDECIKDIGGRPFDLLVDMTKLVTFTATAQRELIEHQKWLISAGMKRAAAITPNAVVNTALDTIRSRSDHAQEFKFASREEAIAFLKE